MNEMYRQIPERWMEGELGVLREKEHNKYRNQHILVWVCSCALGILLSLLIKNILPLPIAVVIAIILSYKVGDENQIEYTPGNEVYDTFMQLYAQNYNADLKTKEEVLAPQIHKLTEEYETYIKQNLLLATTALTGLYAKEYHPSKISELHRHLTVI